MNSSAWRVSASCYDFLGGLRLERPFWPPGRPRRSYRVTEEGRALALRESERISALLDMARANRLARPKGFSESEKGRIRQMVVELAGPHAAMIRQKVWERLH